MDEKKSLKKTVVTQPTEEKPIVKTADSVKKVEKIPMETPPPAPVIPGVKKLTDKQISEFKERLLALRDRVSGEYSTLSRDNVAANQRDASLSDQGTDTFDREMELNMMGSEQEVLFEIDAALRRIEKGTFGICELTGQPIDIERLNALPYVRYTVRAQSELEKGRARYRPFGGTMRG
ncbi:MAG: DnaK suppressor protein [Verrucomicrobiota bacterium]|jgi:RNA polymerase-binding protein DksA|nr:DnaK suppressor protein [Verrucomicrobiota bacterium]MDK2962930.1 DnaK suppressor protein [Verrucomicrobiota bacterium]